MFDFANLVAEYTLRVALWPGLGLSLPLALALLLLRRLLPLQAVGRDDGQVGRDLVSIAAALVLLATLPIPGLSINLPLFGVLPSGQQLADPLFAMLLLPLAALSLLNRREQALRWLIAWLPAAISLLAVLAMGSSARRSDSWATLVTILAALACVPLLLTSDALMRPRVGARAERWLGGLAQQLGWLALTAVLLELLFTHLPADPPLHALIYGVTALSVALLARLINRRWPPLGSRGRLIASAAALLALLVALFEK